MQEPAPGVFMFDFGQDISGFVRLKVEGTRGYLYKTTTFLLQQKSLFYQDRLRTTETDTSGKLAEYCAVSNRAIIQLRHGDVLTYPKLVRKRLGTRNLHLSQGCLGKPSSFHRKELYSYTVDLICSQGNPHVASGDSPTNQPMGTIYTQDLDSANQTDVYTLRGTDGVRFCHESEFRFEFTP